MGDWLGTGNIASYNRIYRPFEEARNYAHSLKLSSKNSWIAFAKTGRLAEDIPANPYQTYKRKGWVNWGDWLGKK